MGRVVGHYAPRALAGLVGALLILALVPGLALPWQLWVAVLGIALGLGLAILAHHRHLCLRCVGALPLNAAAAAERYARRFRAAHLFERRPVALGYLAAVALCSLLYADPVGRYFWVGAQLSLVYLMFAYVTHQRLQPWCPRCRHGGQEHAAPATPTPILTTT
ncbi:hypothetical protein GCM10010124_22450 [Pilimelia terevasa]|uniref:Uncharacterized protein n=1 Tax=Pilimelia terevasa TaxID=53372 RepID=A0A8J3BRW8_9ACTN|nr:hypothetical protein [Pilimelia terevasa]GGK29198.1 hypothetical protein GCM10010124_22450 [Pilimelia terevasa]